MNHVHPFVLKAKAAASAEDNPNWCQAMNGQFADEYWEAAVTEIETLEFMKAWEVVERQDDMNVLRSTWAFKLETYPDGLIKNSRLVSVLYVTCNSKGLVSLKHMLQCFSGRLSCFSDMWEENGPLLGPTDLDI